MARRRAIPVPWMGPEPEERKPEGALRFADPATAEFPRHIHEFNPPEYHSPRARPDGQRGIDSLTGSCVPWSDRRTGDSWAAMNRKRGLSDSEHEE